MRHLRFLMAMPRVTAYPLALAIRSTSVARRYLQWALQVGAPGV